MASTHVCSPLDSVTQSLELRLANETLEIEQLRASLNDAFNYYRNHREKSVKIITTASPRQD